jgi:hypothetical protein
MPSSTPSRLMLKVYVVVCVAVLAVFLYGAFLMVLQPQDNQNGFTGSSLLTEVAPLGATNTSASVDLLDRIAITESNPIMTIRWRAPSEYLKPDESSEIIVLRALMQRLSRLQESPAASNDKAKALYKLMEAEQVLLGSELRGDMPSFPGTQ